ncbi:DUF2117 domain-containing protein [Methanothrix sp.]|uniref:DUF2117 domain-containing protein n=1 Tax=Methanothrix sp. TaxID=90426 RepID=UPI0032972247
MSRILEAIAKLEAILESGICFSRREELQEILDILKEELASSEGFHIENKIASSSKRIGVVVHGPEIIDSGHALQLIDHLKQMGRVNAVLGGTMGRLAVIDADLDGIISINSRRRPSISIRDMAGDSDIVIILNQAKSRETGLAFGTMVAKLAGIDKPLIQIDCGGRFVADLTLRHEASEASDSESKNSHEGLRVAARLAADLGLDLLRPRPRDCTLIQGDTVRRILTGVIPGELISVNGTVIGRAAKPEVEIKARGGKITDLKGAEPKAHGLEKLSRVDLENAIIRSGSIRRSTARPRIKEARGEGAAFIDHCAEDAFEAASGAALALTVGDDTTAIAGDILARLGIAVVGIVDGDIDHLAQSPTIMPGSIIIRVRPGYDDIIGRRVHDEIFRGEERISISAHDLGNRVADLAGELLLERKEVRSDLA